MIKLKRGFVRFLVQLKSRLLLSFSFTRKKNKFLG